MSGKELIDLGDRALIKTILENLKSFNTKIRLWQKLTSMHKVNFAKVEYIDLVENKVHLRPFKGKQFHLTPCPYIFFHSNHRTTLFKTTIQDRNAFHLEIKVPQFVKIQEGRTEERKPLGQNSAYSASIKLEGNGENLMVQVLDLSDNGAALGVPRIFYEMCDLGSFVTVNSKNVPHLSGRIAVVRNKATYAPDPMRPNLLKFRLGLEIFKEKDLEEYL